MISVSQSTTFVSEEQSPLKSSRFYQVIVDVHLLSHEEISIGVCVGIKLPHVFDAEYRADSKQPNLCILLAANGRMPVYGPKIVVRGQESMRSDSRFYKAIWSSHWNAFEWTGLDQFFA